MWADRGGGDMSEEELRCVLCGTTEIIHTYTIWNRQGEIKKKVGVCAKCKPQADEMMNMLGTKM